MPAKSRNARQVARKRKTPRRKKASPARRGLAPTETGESIPESARALAAEVDADGGEVLGVYREPLGGHPTIFAVLPIDKVEPSPYQRDLSEPHVKRLVSAMERVDRFLDPLIAVRHEGSYWTPNGNHRLASIRALGGQTVLALLIPEPEVAFQILALNTEKAHNLKEKSLEVIRMYRGLAEEQPSTTEEEWVFQFESAHFITLGMLYEQNKRFAGGAFAPILRRVDKFLKMSLRKGLEERAERAELVCSADETLVQVVAKVKKRGINHPYVKNYLLTRTTPLTRARKTLPSFEQTFKKLRSNLEDFDVTKVRYDEIQRSAIMMAPAAVE